MTGDCERVLARLSAYLDRELEDGERSELRCHLDGCPPCNGQHARLERLKAISIRVLRGAPAVVAADWSARWTRIDRDVLNPRAAARRARRERIVRLYLGTFALAASVLVAATLALPFLVERPAMGHPAGHLCYSNLPGGNGGEVVELEADSDKYSIGVQVPDPDSSDAVVITISKL